jgi:hypothetical protein
VEVNKRREGVRRCGVVSDIDANIIWRSGCTVTDKFFLSHLEVYPCVRSHGSQSSRPMKLDCYVVAGAW